MRIEVARADADPACQHLVTERSIQAFAAAVGDVDSDVLDPGCGDGVIAHPLFVVCLEWPLIRDGVSGLLFPDGGTDAGVHVSHDLVVHRPVRSGDALCTTARLVSAEPRSNGVFTTVDLSTVTVDGAAVADTRMGTLFVGGDLAGPSAPRTKRPVTADPRGMTDVGAFDIDIVDAIVYSECTGIWNPIHTDTRAARQVGFDSPIMHGTAVLARCVSMLARCSSGRGLLQVRRVTSAFGDPVPLPSTVTVSTAEHDSGSGYNFQARTSATSHAVKGGSVEFR
jgi:acyl dehydratase